MSTRKHHLIARYAGIPAGRDPQLPVAAPVGCSILRSFLDLEAQRLMLTAVGRILDLAPPFRPLMPVSGRPFSLKMSNAGPLGWISDQSGYRYEERHPATGRHWPPIPEVIMEVWRKVALYPALPEACLINLYGPDARLGLHQDRDEAALAAPVVSISLGNAAVFRIGGLQRSAQTQTTRLDSGDVVVLGGPSRLAFHGIDRVLGDTSPLPPLPGGAARINLTLRRVSEPAMGSP